MQLQNDTGINLAEILKNKYPNSALNGENQFKSFTSIEEEYNALRYGVGIRDISSRFVLKMMGKDVSDFLHRVSTNSIQGMKSHEKINTLFTNDKGKIIDRTSLIRLFDDYYLISSSTDGNLLLSWIEKYIIMEDISLQIAAEEFFIFEILGPRATGFLTLLGGRDVDNMNDKKIVRLESDDHHFFAFEQNDNKSLKSYWLIGHFNYAPSFIEFLLSRSNLFDQTFVGSEAYEIYRIEQGIPVMPNELNYSINPHEAGLLNDISFSKGCYIGQEVIARLDTYDKVRNVLAGVIFEDSCECSTGMKILTEEDQDAGIITSFTESKLVNRKIGLAYIKKKFVENGQNLFVINGHNRQIINTTELPFKK